MNVFEEFGRLQKRFMSLKRDIDRTENRVRRLVKRMPSESDRRAQKWMAKMYPELGKLHELAQKILPVQTRMIEIMEQLNMPVDEELKATVAGIEKMVQDFNSVKEKEAAISG